MSENDIEKDLIDLLHEHHDTKESHIHISKILEERLKKYE